MRKDLFYRLNEKLLKPIEAAPFSWGHWLVIMLLSVAVRNLLESALEIPHVIGITSDPFALRTIEENFFHIPFFYLTVFFYLILILKVCSRESITKVSKALVTFSPIIILPPILDTLFFHFRGFRLLYPTEVQQIFVIVYRSFTNIFGPSIYGISPGMRIEIALGALLAAGYVLIKRRNILWAFIALLFTIIGSALIGIIPAGVAQLSGVLLKIDSHNIFNQVYYGAGLIGSPIRKWGLVMLSVFTIELVIWFALYNRQEVRRILKIFFSLGAWVYASILLSGFVIGLGMLRRAYTTLFSNIFDWIAPPVIIVVGLLFWTVQKLSLTVYSPGGVEEKEKKTVLIVCSILLFFFSLSLGYPFLLLILFALGLLWFYQVPPMNLSRFFPASTLFLSTIVVALALAGFTPFGGTRSIMIFPWRLLGLILVAGILAFSVKDFYDSKPGFNLRTIFGPRIGRIISGILLALTILATPLIIPRPQLWPYVLIVAPLSLVLFLLVSKDPKPVLGCALLYDACVTFVLFRNPILNEPELEPELRAIGSFFDGEHYSELVGTMDPKLQPTLYTNALKSYTTALENNSKKIVHPGALHFRLGLTYMGLNQYVPAVLEFQKAYDETKDNSLSYLGRAPVGGALGLAYFKLGQEAESKVVFEELVHEGRDLAKVYYQLAVLEKRKRQLAEAERHFFYTILLGEMFDEALSHLADIHWMNGDLKGAEALYKRVFFYNPSYIPFYLKLGSFYWENRRFAAAESIYRKAITVAPREPILYNNLAMAIDAQGRWQLAVQNFGLAIQINPDFIDAYLNLAVVFERQGLVERAKTVLSEALKRDPENSQVQRMLERLNKKQT